MLTHLIYHMIDGKFYFAETPERYSRGTVVQDLLEAQIDKPIRVIALDIAEPSNSRDVSKLVAREIAARLIEEGHRPSWGLHEFLENQLGIAAVNEIVEEVA